MITKEEYEKASELAQNYRKQEADRISLEEKTIDKGKGKCMEKHCSNFAVVDYNGHGYWVCKSCDDRLERYFEDEYK